MTNCTVPYLKWSYQWLKYMSVKTNVYCPPYKFRGAFFKNQSISNYFNLILKTDFKFHVEWLHQN